MRLIVCLQVRTYSPPEVIVRNKQYTAESDQTVTLGGVFVISK